MGGGTEAVIPRAGLFEGLSPRGRGNRGLIVAGADITGSIPAWAGEPHRAIAPGVPVGVYPRVGGDPGLDPKPEPCVRSIPAWAGEPVSWG